MSAPFPPGTPGITQTIAAYLYWQYSDDENLQAFIDAFNNMAQGYVDCFQNLDIPVYTAGPVAGAYLDWVGAGVYGLERPTLPSQGTSAEGPYASFEYAGLQYAGYAPAQGGGYFQTSDDFYKRVITWAFYKGDGKVCSVTWLKRRIARFLNFANGASGTIDQTADISVTFPTSIGAGSMPSPSYSGLIRVPASPAATIFLEAVNSGVLELPFQWTWTVQTWTPSYEYLLDSSGNIITDSSGYPLQGTS